MRVSDTSTMIASEKSGASPWIPVRMAPERIARLKDALLTSASVRFALGISASQNFASSRLQSERFTSVSSAPEKSAELDDRSLADFGKLYFGDLDANGARKVAHEFAADILGQFGHKSLLGTKIYFVSDRQTNVNNLWAYNVKSGQFVQKTHFISQFFVGDSLGGGPHDITVIVAAQGFNLFFQPGALFLVLDFSALKDGVRDQTRSREKINASRYICAVWLKYAFCPK